MKRKYGTLLISVIVVAAALLGIWLLTRPQTLGNINHPHSGPDTGVSSISFEAEAGDRVKISLDSDIESGTLEVVVYDSNGNALKELEQAKKPETLLTLEQSDTYTLKAEYKDFTGSYRISVDQ